MLAMSRQASKKSLLLGQQNDSQVKKTEKHRTLQASDMMFSGAQSSRDESQQRISFFGKNLKIQLNKSPSGTTPIGQSSCTSVQDLTPSTPNESRKVLRNIVHLPAH